MKKNILKIAVITMFSLVGFVTSSNLEADFYQGKNIEIYFNDLPDQH